MRNVPGTDIQLQGLTGEVQVLTSRRRTVCSYTFNGKWKLMRHMLILSYDEPYKCACCVLSFNVEYRLVVHTHTHTGDRPFACEICSLGFIS